MARGARCVCGGALDSNCENSYRRISRTVHVTIHIAELGVYSVNFTYTDEIFLTRSGQNSSVANIPFTFLKSHPVPNR